MYFLPLNLKKFDVINPNWVRPKDITTLDDNEYSEVNWKGSEYINEVFTASFLEKLSTISEISGFLIFNKINCQSPSAAHIDVAFINNQPTYINYGLNIVFDDNIDFPSKMQWYSCKVPLSETGPTSLMNFSMEELILEDEHCIDEYVTLVRTNVPHSISCGNSCRTCISIRFHNNYDWGTATNLFNKTFNQ
jgi:hypothetical protein